MWSISCGKVLGKTKILKISLHYLFKAFFVTLMISCVNQGLITRTIPLHSSEAMIEIKLPSELSHFKTSVHLSDCKPCGRFHTIFSSETFVKRVEDTTGFFTTWLINSNSSGLLYIEEELYPDSDSGHEKRVTEEDLKFLRKALHAEDPRSKVLRSEIVNKIALVKYEAYNQSGLLISRNIDCITYVNNQFVKIFFIQNHDFQNDVCDKVWVALENLRLLNDEGP